LIKRNIEEKLNINNLSLASDKSDIYKFEGENFKKKFNEEPAGFIIPTYMEVPRVRIQINPHLEEKKPYNIFNLVKLKQKGLSS
jgi:hypothetical protein